ncbi:oligosaccharide repeat unit polymerase [bacterium]|nr:oligosaccharide repeat unit polymerase [bacterium]MBU1676666.1 oligosaccharide repeat unit polymerase [bacterium]
MLIAAIIILILNGTFHWLIERNLTYPPVMLSALWVFLMVLAFSASGYESVSGTTVVVYVAGLVGFGLGSLIGLVQPARFAQNTSRTPRNGGHIGPFVGVAVIGIGVLPLLLIRMFTASATLGISNPLLAFRLANSSGDGPGLGAFSYVIAWMTFAAVAAFALYGGDKKRRGLVVLLFIVALIYQILSASRTGVGILLFSAACVSAVSRRRIPIKLMLLAGGGFLALFLGVALVLGKTGVQHLTGTSSLVSMLHMVRHYLISGIVAFDQVVADPTPFEGGFHSLRFFSIVANVFGAGIEVPDLVLEYVMTPYPTNVYTMFFPSYVDFGLAGVVVYGVLLGWTCCLLYRWAQNGSLIGTALFGLALAKLLISGITEHFLVSVSYWVQATLVFYLLLGRGRRIRSHG